VRQLQERLHAETRELESAMRERVELRRVVEHRKAKDASDRNARLRRDPDATNLFHARAALLDGGGAEIAVGAHMDVDARGVRGDVNDSTCSQNRISQEVLHFVDCLLQVSGH
jgi:hypothetical protein